MSGYATRIEWPAIIERAAAIVRSYDMSTYEAVLDQERAGRLRLREAAGGAE